jgi:tetratricopeptide (TPR) repeat protein
MAELSSRTHSLRDQGLQALRDGDDTRAIDLLTRAVLSDDRDAESRACLGIAYSRKGLHPQAIRLLQETVGLAPDSPNYRFNLGVALDRAGQTEAAREAFLDVLRLAPNHAQAQQRLEAIVQPVPPPINDPPPPEPEPAPLEEAAPPIVASPPVHDPFSAPPPSPLALQVMRPPLLVTAPPVLPEITGYLLLPVGLSCGLFGIAALILGISAWSMGSRDLAQMDMGRMDPSGRKSTVRGRTSGIVLTFLSLLDLLAFLVLLIALISSGKLQSMGVH